MRSSPEGVADHRRETVRKAPGNANHFMTTGYARERRIRVGRRAMRVVRELLGFLPAALGTLRYIAGGSELVPDFYGFAGKFANPTY
jgi:hypothetical protein